jgi:hypothetical protein
VAEGGARAIGDGVFMVARSAKRTRCSLCTHCALFETSGYSPPAYNGSVPPPPSADTHLVQPDGSTRTTSV